MVLALLVAGGFWFLNPQPALAGEVAEHVVHEAGSWDMREPLSADAVGEVLRQAGVEFDSTMPVVYAMACPFRGRRVPHLVVQTVGRTVDRHAAAAREGGRRARNFPSTDTAACCCRRARARVAVLSRAGAVPESVAAEIASSVRW